MTISAVPFAVQNAPVNADVVRQAVSSLIPNGGGLVQAGDMAVTQLGTPAMGVQVGVGRAWIDGTNLAHLTGQGYGKQGMYFVLNDAAYTVTISTSDATNPRIDVIYAAVPDSQYAGSSNTPVIAVATGTPVAGASYPANAPSVPNNAIKLAWIMVGANVTTITNSNITQLAVAGLYPSEAPLVYSNAPRTANANLMTQLTNHSVQPILQGGSNVCTTDGNGYANFTFPKAFPGGLISCTGMNGDTGTGADLIFSAGVTVPTATTMYFRVWKTSTNLPLANSTVRFDWTAMGW